MFGIGMPEMVIIMVIALIVMGPQKLPELARSLGKGLAEFKRASNDFRRSMDEESKIADEKERMAKETVVKEALEPETTHETAAIVTPIQQTV